MVDITVANFGEPCRANFTFNNDFMILQREGARSRLLTKGSPLRQELDYGWGSCRGWVQILSLVNRFPLA
ncbi:MAG: hypothetical protein ACRCT1_14670 [Microcoleaceae cyanobacterium]